MPMEAISQKSELWGEAVTDWLITRGVSAATADYLGWVLLAAAVVLAAWIANWLTRRILLSLVAFLVRKSRTKWDDALLDNRVFARLAHFAPAIVFYYTAELFGPAQVAIERLSQVYMLLAGLLTLNAFLNAVNDIYGSFDVSSHRPIKGYLQVVKIFLAVLVGVIAVAVLIDRSPLVFVSGLGAMTAILLLVFKDTILGLVASIQLSMNDMVRIGDWIEMPKFGADGDVIDITLHTVKVQNWDKTITTIPAYALISDSFKNWRGMSESGGRRIKRAVKIDMTSIRLCSEAMLDRFEKYQLITDYVRSRREEIRRYNLEQGVDVSELINGRRMTNVGTFRAYVAAYLRNHPQVSRDLTFLVRQLPPTEHGLPIEVYVFSKEQRWAEYEGIQADIFDHILAVVPLFELKVYQQPSGADVRALAPGGVGDMS